MTDELENEPTPEPEPRPDELHEPGSDDRSSSERAPTERETHPINALHGNQKGARAVAVHERAAEMLTLRKAGVLPNELAQRYGISAGRVRAIISHELRKNRAKAASELRDLYESRYEDLIRAYARDALGWTERREGQEPKVHPPDIKAAEFVLKTYNELRKLQGLEKLVIEYEGASQEERAAGLAGQLRAYLQGVEDAETADAPEALSGTNGDAAPSS